ncbi:hypothetical protein AMTRI_Chr01g113930 [Amborella trichopoda]
MYPINSISHVSSMPSRRTIISLLAFTLFLSLKPSYSKRLFSNLESLEDHDICDHKNLPASHDLRGDQLTLLISGFSETRLPLIRQIAAAYSSLPSIFEIFIIWGNTSTPSDFFRFQNFESLGAPISVIRDPHLSLNLRFSPRGIIRTRAVATCDDDVLVDPASVHLAFRVWQRNPEKLVGFFARSHSYDISSKSWIYTVDPAKFSMVLTKFMILSIEYLFEYSCKIPARARGVVDEWRNCEDILMNFVVSSGAKSGPILVEGKARDWGDARNEGGVGREVGLSMRNVEHRKRRGLCIEEFHRILGRMPLRYSYGRVVGGVGEQGMCEKGGDLVLCDQELGG